MGGAHGTGIDPDRRVLLRGATARDSAMAVRVLRAARIDAVAMASLDALVDAMADGVGLVLLAEETVLDPAFPRMRQALRAQPAWSDLQVTLLAKQGADSALVAEAMDLGANVTVMERPLRVSALVSVLRSGLRMRERQYELRRLLQELETADGRKNEFLATLAHELRNPLAPISTGLTFLRLALPDTAPVNGTLTMMARQVTHMTRLIDDLMQVSRITRGKIELQREILALDHVLAEAIEACLPLVESKGHTLTVNLPPGRWQADLDGVRMTQVFVNLLNNAAKYSPPGSHIELSLEQKDDGALVRVRDDGEGIAPERLHDIFGMFVQVGERSREAQGGLGIGLTLCKSLVTLHGGTIRAHSEGLGRGSKFEVWLPLANPGAVATPVEATVAPTRLRGEVLVVDDNRDAADALALLLSSIGADVQVAYDGPSALKVASRHPPHVALLDIGMPGMDGCELARRLRSDERLAAVRLIALTGWGQPDDRARIFAAGFEHHLLKPIDAETLIPLLKL